MKLVQTNLDGILPLVSRGKVRDVYKVDDSTLLFVATDRISAYDVIMGDPIEDKGIILTKLSEFWFDFLKEDVKNHLKPIEIGTTIFDYLPSELSFPKYKNQLENRSLLIEKHKLIPLEVIVRGYISGSAWSEYRKTGTIHGMTQPVGLQESQELPTPIFTPSTKADHGEHDENISLEQAYELIGKDLCDRVSRLAIKLYSKCQDYAKTKGILIADTKFEFGIDEKTNEIILVDEVLTPDSSRFWSSSHYKSGQSQSSYDKQFLRNWLVSNKLDHIEGVSIPQDISEQTREKYLEVYKLLTGHSF